MTSPPSVPRRRPLLRALGWLALLAALAAAALAYYGWRQLDAPQSEASVGVFEVMPGWGASRVAAELGAQGFVRDARIFSLYLRWRGLERSLGEGLYDLDRSMAAEQVADLLARVGRPRTVFVIIPEGLRLPEVARRLAEAGFGDEADLLALMQEPGDLLPADAPEGATLEGYLFPAGYEFRLGAAPQEVVAAMLGRFAEERERFAVALAESGLSSFEWLTLGSMIQAEAADDSEMPIIAGVFLNRLERGMWLQSDPTAAYGLGKPLPELVAADLRVDTPWNTYTRPGLPVGPINSPGSAALASVFAPVWQNGDGEDYLYFLHGSDAGVPVFRPNPTLERHEADIERYLR